MSTTFPLLEKMMSAYFNQDYDLMGDSDQEIVQDYARTHRREELIDVVAEIDDMLRDDSRGLLDRFTAATGRMNMSIGDDDDDARRWLVTARDVLATSPAFDRT